MSNVARRVVGLLALAILSCSPPPEEPPRSTSVAPGRGLAPAQMREVLRTLNRFEGWANGYLRTRDEARTPEGVTLALARRDAMVRLIEGDPRRAVELALPWSVRRQLPDEVRALVERQVDGRGNFEVLVSLQPPGSTTPEEYQRFVVLGGRRYLAFAEGDRLGAKTRDNVRVHGMLLDDRIALSDEPVRVLEEGEPVNTDLPVKALAAECAGALTRAHGGDAIYTLCGTSGLTQLSSQLVEEELTVEESTWTEGAKTVLYILVDFSDVPGAVMTQAEVQTLFDGTVGPYYASNTYGKTSLTTTVTPLYRMPQTGAYYATGSNYVTLLSDARAAATAGGYNLSNYNLDIVGFKTLGYGWLGLGYVGGKGTWNNGSNSLIVHGHELGHNFGVYHADYWAATDDTIIGPGTLYEYSNPFDIMGNINGWQMNSWYKSLLGWLTSSSYQTVTASGTYQLAPLDETVASGLQALKIARGDGTRWYWVDYRSTTSSTYLQNGVEITWGYASGTKANESRLLDMTPGSSLNQYDAPLLLGRTFSDTNANVHITPTSIVAGTPSKMNVVVNIGPFASNQAPTATISASATTVAVNGSVTFTTTATDADGDTLAYAWDFGDNTFGANAASVTKTFTSQKDHRVVLTVSDMKGGTARKAVTVRVGSPSTYQASGRVTLGGVGLPGVRIAKGTSSITFTDDNGDYTLVNVSGSSTLTATKAGYTFTAGFSNPQTISSHVSGLNWTSAAVGPYSITGRVTDGTSGFAGVTISDGARTAVTDSNGDYTLTSVPNGIYTLTATKTGYAFSSTLTQPVEVLYASITGADFATTGVTVTGAILNATSAPTVTDGYRTVTATLSSGSWVYSLSRVPPGSYTLVATLSAFDITPLNFTNPLTVATSSLSSINFTANPWVYPVTGTVTHLGSALPGVTLTSGTRTATTNSSGQFTLSLPDGTHTLTPSLSGFTFTPASRSVTVSGAGSTGQNFASASGNLAPTVASAASATPNPVTTAATNLAVLGADDYGEAALSYTWSSSGPAAVTFSVNGSNAAKSTTATFTKAGTYTLTATLKDAGNLTATSAVSVTVSQVLTSVSVSPSTKTMGVGTSATFSASALDQFANALSPQPSFAWATPAGGGAVTSGGVFTAGNAVGGPFTVTATTGGLTGTATVTLNGGTAPTIATAAAASPATVTATTSALSVLGADDGGESNLVYTWASTGPAPVTFSANGSNAAKSTTATFTAAGSYTFTVTAKDAGDQTVTSSKTVTVSQTMTAISVTPASATVLVAATQAYAASATDQFGNTLSTQPTFTWTLSAGGTVSSAGLVTASNAVGGPYTVTATSGAKSGTAAVTVSAGSAPTVSTPAAASPATVTGSTSALTVLGADDGTEANLVYTWTSTGPAAVSFSANGTNAAKSTTATFSAAGSYTLTATAKDGGNQTVTSSVAVTVQQTLTTVSVSPSSATVLVAGTQAYAASAKDQFGAALSPQPAITWSVNGGGTVGTTGLFTASNAVGGPYTVTATSGAKSGTASVTVSAGSAPTVASAAAASPASVTGATSALAVLGADDGTEANLVYTWTSTGPATVSFSANASNAAKSTTATFTAAGSYTLTATLKDGGNQTATSSVAVTVQQTATTLTVSPSAATVLVGGTQQLVASVKDQFGAALSSQPSITWSASGGGTVSSTGLFTAGTTVGGPHTLTASASGLSGTSVLTISAGAPPTIATAASATPSPATSTTTSLSVLGADDGGEGALVYGWAASGPAPVSFSANDSNAAKSTTATFLAAGSYTFTVTVRDGGNQTVTSSKTVTVSQTLTTLTVSPSSSTVLVSGTQQLSASARDQFGNALTPQPTVSWSVSGGGTVSSSGLFTAGATVSGPHTVTATSGGKSGTASLTLSAGGVPTVATPAAASPSLVVGTTSALTVLGADDSGESNLSYTWSSSGPTAVSFSANGTHAAKSTTATFSAAGSYTLTATMQDGGGQTVSSSVNVTVQATFTTLAVSPASAVVLVAGTQQLSAIAKDQFNTALATQPTFTWSTSGGGAVSSSGLFTAGAVVGGPHSVTASASGKSASSSLTVSAGAPPSVATAAVASPSTVTGATAALSVLGADDGTEANLTYTWTSTGPAAVSFSANGTNAAKSATATFAAAGSYTLTATLKDGGNQTVTSSVGVVVQQTPTSLSVTPSTSSVGVAGTRQLTATVKDQFGTALATQPAVSWTVSGGGTVSSTGLFTAGTTVGGPFNATATAASLTGSASLTVTAGAAPTIASAASATPSPVTGTTTALAVLGADDGGEANLLYTWTSTGPAAVSFSANGTNAAKSTTATFSAAGSYTFLVTVRDGGDQSVTSSKTVTVSQTLSAVQVTPGSTTVSVSGSQQLTASARDQFGNALTPQPTFSWSVSGGGAVSTTGLFSAGASVGGPHTVTATAGARSGTATVSISAGGIPTVATPAAASPAAVTGTTTALTVLGADDGGESNLVYAWSATGPAPVTFSVNNNHAARSSTATFTAAGSYVLSATIQDSGNQTVTSSVTVTVQQTLHTISVAPASATVLISATQTFAATGMDQFGALLASQPTFSWMSGGGGSVSSGGVFTPDNSASGPHVLTASSGGKTGTANVTVSAGAIPTVSSPAAASSASVTTRTTSLSVLGADDGTEANLVYTWTASGPAGVTFSPNGSNAAKASTATFSAPGTYALTVTLRDGGNQSVTSTAHVTVVATLSTLQLSPAMASVTALQSQTFTATGLNQFGAPMSASTGVTWSVSGGGTVSSAGVFTAGGVAGGPYLLTASGGNASTTASVTVVTATAPRLSSPPTASVASSTSTQLSVVATDNLAESGLVYTWAVTSGPGGVTFSANGTNAAKSATATFAAAGSYTFTVTVRDQDGETAVSSVNIAVAALPTSVTVAPASVSLEPGGAASFAATVKDQFGTALAAQPSLVWNVSGGGTVDLTGHFVAGQVLGGPFTLTCATAGATGQALVTVGDLTSPVLTVTAPTAGATLTGAATLSADATDNVGVAKVTFELGGQVVGTVSAAPWAMQLDTRSRPNGATKVKVTAEDAAGNKTSKEVSVTLANSSSDAVAPTVEIFSPSEGSTLRGRVVMTARALDDQRVVEVSYELDGHSLGKATVEPWTVQFDSSLLVEGSHTLVAIAVDASGNVGRSPDRHVLIGAAPQPERFEEAQPPSGCASVPGSGQAGWLALGSFALAVLGRRRRP